MVTFREMIFFKYILQRSLRYQKQLSGPSCGGKLEIFN